eukprot:scaffold467_cov120-Skeletonema_menzelii.AAC.2
MKVVFNLQLPTSLCGRSSQEQHVVFVGKSNIINCPQPQPRDRTCKWYGTPMYPLTSKKLGLVSLPSLKMIDAFSKQICNKLCMSTYLEPNKIYYLLYNYHVVLVLVELHPLFAHSLLSYLS